MNDDRFTNSKFDFFAAARNLCRDAIDHVSIGNLTVGFVLGVGSIVAAAEIYSVAQDREIANAAAQFAADPSQINQTFSETGKGLVGVDIGGRKCVINMGRSLDKPDLYFTACLPR